MTDVWISLLMKNQNSMKFNLKSSKITIYLGYKTSHLTLILTYVWKTTPNWIGALIHIITLNLIRDVMCLLIHPKTKKYPI